MYSTIQKEPTTEFYNNLQKIYYEFNKSLFDNRLSNCMITLQRQHGTMGYFSPNRFVNKDGSVTHEIALNPSYFAQKNVIEVFQTLVHEMAHLWQYDHGKTSRKSYHNKEWADKMESIGLMPSSTGRKGGNKTGQKMSDYPIKNSLFEQKSLEILESKLFIQWFERNSLGDHYFEMQEQLNSMEDEIGLYTPISNIIPNIQESNVLVAKKKIKSKYTCECGINLWGRPSLHINCNDCGYDFTES